MNVSEAAECIWEGYRRGEFFPADLVGQLSFDEALRVQLDILERRLARGERLAGWKIGLTSATVRAHFGTDRQTIRTHCRVWSHPVSGGGRAR